MLRIFSLNQKLRNWNRITFLLFVVFFFLNYVLAGIKCSRLLVHFYISSQYLLFVLVDDSEIFVYKIEYVYFSVITHFP